MIRNKKERITYFSYPLRNDLYKAMREDFIDRFYEVNAIYDEQIRETFEEAVREMDFKVFKEIYEMCHLMGYKAAKSIIVGHINIMMNNK